MERSCCPAWSRPSTRSPHSIKKLDKLPGQPPQSLNEGEELGKSSERNYDKLKSQIVEAMKNVRLNNGRIEQLVEQLYDLNRRLVDRRGPAPAPAPKPPA